VLNVGFTSDLRSIGAYKKIKVVGSDNGKYEYDTLMTTEMISPSERTVVEAYFDTPGTYFLTHETRFPASCLGTRDSVYVLGRIIVSADSVDTDFGTGFALRDSSAETKASMDPFRAAADSALNFHDRILVMTGVMGQMAHDMGKVSAAARPDPGEAFGKCVEWYDNMPAANSASTTMNMRWILRDSLTRRENHDINWRFKVGDRVKIRIINSPQSAHPMAHPIHFHGQRFLVVGANGIPNRNMVWKDTYLVGLNQTVDILLDASNPGGWMAHCHISEHAEGMMMFSYYVDP
jgi:ribosomal protein L21E